MEELNHKRGKDKLLCLCLFTQKTQLGITGVDSLYSLTEYIPNPSLRLCCFDHSPSCNPLRKTELKLNSAIICCVQESIVIVGKGLLSLPDGD